MAKLANTTSTAEKLGQDLVTWGKKHGYLNPRYLNLPLLVADTHKLLSNEEDIIGQGNNQNRENFVYSELLDIWFPAIAACASDLGNSMENYHAIDIKIVKMVRKYYSHLFDAQEIED